MVSQATTRGSNKHSKLRLNNLGLEGDWTAVSNEALPTEEFGSSIYGLAEWCLEPTKDMEHRRTGVSA